MSVLPKPWPSLRTDPVRVVVEALSKNNCDPVERGKSWDCYCPVHRGGRRNLTIDRGSDGRALLRCQAHNCSVEAIVSAIGLDMHDLFPSGSTAAPIKLASHETKSPRGRKVFGTPVQALASAIQQYGKPSSEWAYRDEEGHETFRVYRFDPPGESKQFRPVHATAKGWVTGDPPNPLPLYNLPKLPAAEVVYVAEGEKCADLLIQLGLVATTSAHGANSARKSDWSPLAGKSVIILPDCDEPGERYADDVLELLSELEPRPTARVLRLPGLSGGGDVDDWLKDGVPESWSDVDARAELERLAGQIEEVDLEQVRECQGETRVVEEHDWPTEPRPLKIDLLPVPKLSEDMLPEAFRGWLVDIAERIGCDVAFPAVGAIVALAAIVGRSVFIRPKRCDDWTVAPNLWGAIVGRPGTLKSPALSSAMNPLGQLAAEAIKSHESGLVEFRAKDLLRKIASENAKDELKRKQKKGETGDQLTQLAYAAVTNAELEPTCRRYSTSDATVEKVGELLRENPRGLLVFRDELVGWVRTFDKAGHEADRAFYLEAWNGNGGTFTYDRIGRGTVIIPSPCISVLGGIQPGPLEKLLRDSTKGEGDDGLISRFQLLVWPDEVPEWRNVDRWPDTEAKKVAFKVFRELDNINPLEFGAERDELDGTLFLRFDPDAQRCFDAWRTRLENEKLKAEGDSPLMESHLAKYRSLMPSLALLFHLVDVADGGLAGPVSLKAVGRSLAWCDYLEAHARRVYAGAGRADIEPAKALRKKLEDGALRNPFQARDVYRRCWSNLGREETELALAVLEDHGWLRSEEVATGGKPRIDYHVHPSIAAKCQSQGS